MFLNQLREPPTSKSTSLQYSLYSHQTQRMATPAKTAPRAPPVSFREVSGRQKVLVNNVIERCDVLTKRFSKELSESLEEIQK